MEVALGVLEWSPESFWKATPIELNRAVIGWKRKNGQGEKQFDNDEFQRVLKEYGGNRVSIKHGR